jgi:DNA repair protein RadC
MRTRRINGKEYFLDEAGYYVPVSKRMIKGDTVSTPEAAAAAFSLLRYEAQEQMAVLSLDTKHHIVSLKVVFKGGLSSCDMEPSSLFRQVIVSSVRYFILGHNHPSGVTDPSSLDRGLTKRLLYGADLLGLTMLDHVIVGPGPSYFSFRESGLLERLASEKIRAAEGT